MPRLTKAAWAAIRTRYETTLDAVNDIARDHGVSHVAVWRRSKEQEWTRPDEVPKVPGAGGDDRLLGRLFRAFERQVADLEQRFLQGGGSVEEKDARTLAVLAKTFETLAKLRDERGEIVDGDAVDLDELRTRLAQRLAALAPYELAGVGTLADAGGMDEPGGAGGAR